MSPTPMTPEDAAHIRSLLSYPHLNRALDVLDFIGVNAGVPFQSLPKAKAAAKILDYADASKDSGPIFLEAVAAWVDAPETLIPVLQRTHKQALIPALDGFLLEQLKAGDRPDMVLNRAIHLHLPRSAVFLREKKLDQKLSAPSPTAFPSPRTPRF